MSARSSRLHALERGVKAPRKSKARARALTVMRLESGTTTVQPSNRRPARLPKDMEDQIAIVRGRTVGKPSRGLLQLEERLLQPRAVGPTSPAVQRHDHGAMPVPPAPVSQAHSLSAQMAATEFGGHYNVESFEDASTPTTPAQISTTPRNEYYAGGISAPAVSTAPPAAVAPCAEPRNTILPSVAPEATERDRVMRRSALNPDHEAVAANFERDISAMLGIPAPANTPENQQWDEAVRNATNAPAVTPQSPAVGTPQPPETPKRNGHEVFNQMGLAMNYANSFDLGAMDLSARFDRFDEELALPSKAPIPMSAASSPTALRTPVEALALNDFDLVEDLAEISGAQPCPVKEDVSTTTPMPANPS